MNLHQANLPPQLFLLNSLSASILLRLSLELPLTALVPFLHTCLCLRPSSSLVLRPYVVSLLFYLDPFMESICLLYVPFLREFLFKLYPDGFPFSVLIMLPRWNAFIMRPVALSPAASRPLLFFFFLKRPYLSSGLL